MTALAPDPTGIVHGMSDTDYHAERDHLSSSGARDLLDSPAKYRWKRENPPAPTQTFNLGHAVHAYVLGSGATPLIGGYDSYRTKEAQAWRDAAHADGHTPLLTHEWEQVRAMGGAVRSHPLASELLRDGEPEVSLFTTDPGTGVKMKARPDWTRPGWLVDLKSTINAAPASFGRTAANFGYHIQAAWYLHTAHLAGLAGEDTRFLFVLVEKEAPYLASVVELDAGALRAGAEQMRRALEVYRDCTTSGIWPGYPDDAPLVGLPGWYYKQLDTEEDYL